MQDLLMNSVRTTEHADAHHISDEQVTAFLGSTNPCYINFPTDMREAAREYLERQMACGDLTHDHLVEFERAARVNAFLGD
jgi:hypothetical protein